MLDSLRGKGYVPPADVRVLLGLPPPKPPIPPQNTTWRETAPRVGPYLPGGVCTLRLDPAAPVDMQSVRHLHGALSRVLGRPHGRMPAWSLVPPVRVTDPWRVAWRRDEDAGRLEATEHRIRLLLCDRVLTVGMARRVPSPAPPRLGRHRLRIDSLVPVVMSRDGHRTAVYAPTAATMQRACEMIAERLGVAGTHPVVENVVCHTSAVSVHVGGHWQRGSDEDNDLPNRGVLRAWEGWLELTANAPAAWLLACAETLGLGGATSLGMGRVRVTEVSR